MIAGHVQGATSPLAANPTGLEAGKRIIICGSSEHVLSLPKSFLQTGITIGINQWPAYYPCDYWIGVDTAILLADPYLKAIEKAQQVGATRFLCHSDEIENAQNSAEYYFNIIPFDSDSIFTQWTGNLFFKHTTAVSALHLALIMAAKEIILYGVDFVGQKRFDTSYSWCWHECVDDMNIILSSFSETTPIYKLHPQSLLDIPLLSL